MDAVKTAISQYCSHDMLSGSVVTLWTIAFQAHLWDFPGKNTAGLPFLPPGGLPNPGIDPASPALAGGFFPLSHLGSPNICLHVTELLEGVTGCCLESTALHTGS